MNTITRYAAAIALSAVVSGTILPPFGEHGGWSLFPPLCAISVAMITGRLVLGLCSALVAAAVIALPPGTGFVDGIIGVARAATIGFVWKPLSESFQLYILAFTVSLIGMVRILSVAGGTRGIAEALARTTEGKRAARLSAWLLGMSIFFDDYANTLVVGTTMRPVFDRFRISREKLAYLVDSTAAPVAGIALISTWIGYEVGLFEDAMQSVGTGISGYELFFLALPSRFYCLLALVFVGASILLRRDFGPMLKAERRASTTGAVMRPGAKAMAGNEDRGLEIPAGVVADWRVAVAPVALVIIGVLAGMQHDAWNVADVVEARQQDGFFSRSYWTTVFSNADGARVMFQAAIAGSVLAFGLAVSRRAEDGHFPITPAIAARAWVGGVTGFSGALIILVLAWAIKEACGAVGTSQYLVAALGDTLPAAALPVLVFLLASVVAFSIGTSWTTMALLLPTTIPLAHTLGGMPIAVLVAAAVLDGAIFGDHCSPISDTTVLSSVASGCDHLDHVKTQSPYALVTMAVAAICGYVGTAIAWPAWIGLLTGIVVICGILWLFGKDPDVEPDAV
ncbi:MAG: Na+/H+ antiporter NhaC family protein [Candidatus Latescibacterota bacterium]